MNRTELINYLMQLTEEGRYVAKNVRGNSMWSLWFKEGKLKIICFQMKKEPDGSYSYTTEYETTPPSTLTCPREYLKKTAVLCGDWRKKVLEYLNTASRNKTEIKRLFEISKKENQNLTVKITAKEGYFIRLPLYLPRLSEVEFIVESVHKGVDARLPENNQLYSIPLRLVTDIRLTAKNG